MIGEEIHKLARRLWGINRSITGPGVRETLDVLKEHLPDLAIHSVASGTSVFDWTVPKEWSVWAAYIITPTGEKICDFSKNNLHLAGYSTPFSGEMPLHELKEHLYSLPDLPSAVPYVTSYYEERWGFCISHNELETLQDGTYTVVIDTQLFNGELNYGELVIPGQNQEEVFLSTYICHPSMANNELSGPTVSAYLAKWISELPDRRYTYRIIFIPETIGSITYLSRNLEALKKSVIAGFNVSCVGDDRAYSYLPSRDGSTLSDFVAKHVLKWVDPNFISYSWLDRGSDERQYCAPGIDLPIASILRTRYGDYPEYHTSLDNLDDVVTPTGLAGGYQAIKLALELIEKNRNYRSTVLCEPQMGKRGLYPSLSTKESYGPTVKLMMDFLSLCDGTTSLIEIADQLNSPAWDLYDLIETLSAHNLIESV